jgi:hypothetical protein
MPKIRIAERKTIYSEIEVEFPIFRRYSDTFDSGTSYEHFERRAEDGTVCGITITEEPGGVLKYELELRKRSPSAEIEAFEPRELVSEKAFNAALQGARDFLAKF